MNSGMMKNSVNMAAPLGARIRQDMRANKAELPFLQKNPLTDFFSFRKRAEITQKHLLMEIYDLAAMDRKSTSYANAIVEFSMHGGAALKAVSSLLEEPAWTGNANRSAVLLDVLSLSSGDSAYKLIKISAQRITVPEQVLRAFQMAKHLERIQQLAGAYGRSAMAERVQNGQQ